MALTRRSFIASSAALAVAGCASPDAAGGAADAPRLEFDGTDANGIRLGMTKCCTFWSYNDNNPGVRVFTVRPDGTYATSIFAESDCRDA